MLCEVGCWSHRIPAECQKAGLQAIMTLCLLHCDFPATSAGHMTLGVSLQLSNKHFITTVNKDGCTCQVDSWVSNQLKPVLRALAEPESPYYTTTLVVISG